MLWGNVIQWTLQLVSFIIFKKKFGIKCKNLEGFSSWMFKGLTFLLPFLIGGYVSFFIFESYIVKFLF